MSSFLRSIPLCILHGHDRRLMPIASIVCSIGVYAGGLATIIGKMLEKTGLDPRCLELETTEAVPLTDGNKVFETRQRLRSFRHRTSINDFGTGHLSLSYPRHVPFDKIKVDRSLIYQVQNKADRTTISEQFDVSIDGGRNAIQGYSISQSLPANLFKSSTMRYNTSVLSLAVAT